MKRIEVVTALEAAGMFGGFWDLDDDTYDALSAQFVQQAFSDWVVSLPLILRSTRDIGGGKTRCVPRYIPEVFDCDNIARSFANFIDEACAVDALVKGRARGNPSFGKFNFTLDGGGGHARNWMLDYRANALVFDAGVGDFVTMTAGELASVSEGESI